jgi:hypothetical protein
MQAQGGLEIMRSRWGGSKSLAKSMAGLLQELFRLTELAQLGRKQAETHGIVYQPKKPNSLFSCEEIIFNSAATSSSENSSPRFALSCE